MRIATPGASIGVSEVLVSGGEVLDCWRNTHLCLLLPTCITLPSKCLPSMLGAKAKNWLGKHLALEHLWDLHSSNRQLAMHS